MNKRLIFLSFLFLPCLLLARKMSKRHATQWLPMHDTSFARFTTMRQFLPIQEESGRLERYVYHIIRSNDFAVQEKWFNKLLEKPSGARLCLLAFDYYFRNQAPLPHTDIERYLDRVKRHHLYPRINKKYLFEISDTTHLRDTIWSRIGWQFGYGTIRYLSAADSIYLAKMYRHPSAAMDQAVVSVINRFLEQQQAPFRYDVQGLMTAIKAIPGVIDAIHDGCLTKTMQLPNWDRIVLMYLHKGDTIERCYTLQIGRYETFRLFRHLKLFSRNQDIVFFKSADFDLHGIKQIREQCEANRLQAEENKRAYEEYMRQKK